MEQTGVMSEEAWSSLSGMYTSKEESELLTQLLSGFSCPNEMSSIWSSDQETSFCNSNECLVSQETGSLSPDDGQSVMYLDETLFQYDDVSRGYERPGVIPRMSLFGDNEMGHFLCPQTPPVLFFMPMVEPLLKSYSVGGLSDEYDPSDIGKFEKQELDLDRSRQGDLPNANAPGSRKRSRNVADVSRSKRNQKSDKCQKKSVADNVKKNDDSDMDITKKSSVSESTEEHSSITHEVTKEETHTVKTSKGGKGKASKGASSDPQSLYARKRRERINERLRILQGLVPNGTKVDISTMLEEAVQYVKFLQLQIKLLSSDDTWMYAPLAYNGMDIGISNFDIPTNTSPR